MRVSSSQTAEMLLNCLQKSYSSYADVAEQMATGYSINSPSDDPVGYSKLQTLTSQQNSISQYQDNIETAESMLSNSETEFDSMADVLSELRSLAVSANNGSYTTSDLSDISEQMSTLMETLMSFCNATDSDGTYMFSGSQSNTQTVIIDSNGDYVYQGDDYQIEVTVADGVTVAASDTIGDIFFDSSSSTSGNFFNDMSDLISSLSTSSDPSSVIESMEDIIDSTSDNLTSAISSIGSRTNELDALNDAHSETLLYSQNLSSEIGDADYSTTAVKAEEIMTNIEATQSVISKVLSLSLFDEL